jgi:hypothetical protein
MLSGGTCAVSVSLASGEGCTALVRFKPTATGSRSGLLRFWVNTVEGRIDVALSGSGLPGSLPDAAASPVSVDFGSLAVGTAGSPVTVTLTNSGAGTLLFAAFGITSASVNQSDFVLLSGGSCAVTASLASGQSCTTLVRFKPTATGSRSGLLRFWANTAAGRIDVALSGNGLPGSLPDASASPVSVDYGSLALGTTGSPVTVTLTNSGAGTLQFAAFGITSASVNPSDFVMVSGGTCAVAASLASGQSCTALVRFKPTATGSRSGLLRFWVNTVAGRIDVALSGDGLPGSLPEASASPVSVDFGSLAVGAAGSPVTVTLTNSGTGTLQFAAFGITSASVNQADFVMLSGGTCAVAVTLASGQSCTTLVRFKPTATGTRSGLLRFWVNTAAGHTDVALRGDGLDDCADGCF